MNHREQAIENYKNGCNCAQSVFCAFEDVTTIDNELGMRLASGFGGGMGGMHKTCGVLTGAFMVLGTKLGFTNTASKEERDAFMATIKAFAEEFEQRYTSCNCCDLTEKAKEEGFLAEKAEDEFYQTKPCAVYVEAAAEMLVRYLNF